MPICSFGRVLNVHGDAEHRIEIWNSGTRYFNLVTCKSANNQHIKISKHWRFLSTNTYREELRNGVNLLIKGLTVLANITAWLYS